MKEIFGVAFFRDIVSACMAPEVDERLFGNQDAQENFAQESEAEDNVPAPSYLGTSRKKPERNALASFEGGTATDSKTSNGAQPPQETKGKLHPKKAHTCDKEVAEKEKMTVNCEVEQAMQSSQKEAKVETEGGRDQKNKPLNSEPLGDAEWSEPTAEITLNKDTLQWQLQRKQAFPKYQGEMKTATSANSSKQQTEHGKKQLQQEATGGKMVNLGETEVSCTRETMVGDVPGNGQTMQDDELPFSPNNNICSELKATQGSAKECCPPTESRAAQNNARKGRQPKDADLSDTSDLPRPCPQKPAMEQEEKKMFTCDKSPHREKRTAAKGPEVIAFQPGKEQQEMTLCPMDTLPISEQQRGDSHLHIG